MSKMWKDKEWHLVADNDSGSRFFMCVVAEDLEYLIEADPSGVVTKVFQRNPKVEPLFRETDIKIVEGFTFPEI